MTAQAMKTEGSGDALMARLRSSLTRVRPARTVPRGDHDLNPGMTPGGALIAAAVLIPVIPLAPAPHVLFTRRALDLADHAGEISFPGGRVETGDPDAVAAALRESWEELGLERGQIEILGALDSYETRTGFRVAPVVGLVAPPIALRPDPREVAEVLEVPLPHLLDPANYRRREFEAGGRPRRFYAIPYRHHMIWGATAGMLMNLCEVMSAE